MSHRQEMARTAKRAAGFGIALGLALAGIKAAAGILGQSTALLADAVESLGDVAGSIAVFLSLGVAAKPPTEKYPYGRGRIEILAAVIVGAILLAVSVQIGAHAASEIQRPQTSPAPWTLLVLAFVALVKWQVGVNLDRVAVRTGSQSVQADALHHWTDALTSGAAFIGISAALLGGPKWAIADEIAAIFAAVVIAAFAIRLLKSSVDQLTDRAPDPQLILKIREAAARSPKVLGTHHCLIRRHGFDLYVDLDILVDPNMTIHDGHEVAHVVQERIMAEVSGVSKVLVHVEPMDPHSTRTGVHLAE